MCYGSLEPKYLMRDIEKRVKGVAFVSDKSEEPGQMPAGGLVVWLWDVFRRITKDLVHG